MIMEHHSLNAGHRAMTTDANRLTRDATVAGSYDPPPRVPVSHVRAFANAIDRLGFNSRLLLSVIGLRASDLDDPDATISASMLDRFICATVEECQMPNLGARLASATPIGAFPLLDYLVVTAETVSDALDQLVRYFHLVHAPMILSIVRDDRSVRLVVDPGENSFGSQYEATLVVHHLRAEADQRLRVSVSLMDGPADRTDLERLLGCKVTAPATWSGVEFPAEDMRLPLRRRDSALRGVLETHAATLTTVEPHSHDDAVVRTIRAEVAARIGKQMPTLEALARQLAKAPRSLQRHLAAKGLSYQQILDETRREGAERLLADAMLSIGEIGYLLGFSEPSAFHRAFKRWHDVTPQEYRSQHERTRLSF